MRGIPQTATGTSLPQGQNKKTLILYFRYEVDKQQATWLVRPYGLKILKITERTPAISFSISDTKQRRAEVENLQSKPISQTINAFIEIPPKIFVIPNSKDDLDGIFRVLNRYELYPMRDRYPATAELSVNENETEEWKTRLALDSAVAMVGEDGILYVTRNFDFSGSEYADVRARLVSASTSFSFILFDPLTHATFNWPHKSQPLPLTPQDLSEKCVLSSTANLPRAIDSVVHRFFGNKPKEHATEIIPIQDVDPGLVKYTIVGVRRLVTSHWEYYELAIEFNTTVESVQLRAFIQGWGAKGPSPPTEKLGYREDLEEERTQHDRLQSKLRELLEDIRAEICTVAQAKVGSDHR
jgi:hypothetical protein